jgi:rhamnopyranosyl-N-acetylglucosaminyl-diphospho-decaprenol beta-1,3/1,4-galactofuranosyltransferase
MPSLAAPQYSHDAIPMLPVSAVGKICAVVVTFNRKDLLCGCLNSLLLQTRRPDAILVIDNASSDGTRARVEQEFPGIEIVTMPFNGGGAGGFHEGIKRAHQAGFDWIWVMDDDIEVLPDTLETMLSYRDIGHFIHVRKMTPEGPLVWEALWEPSSGIAVQLHEDMSFRNGKAWTSVSYGNFEGALIHRSVPERIGYPDPRFFIGLDDTIYGFLASLHVQVIYLNHIGIVRKLARPRRERSAYYFPIRNSFLAYEYLRKSGVSLSRYVFWFSQGRNALRSFGQIASTLNWRSPQNAYTVLIAIIHGASGRFGPPPWLKTPGNPHSEK